MLIAMETCVKKDQMNVSLIQVLMQIGIDGNICEESDGCFNIPDAEVDAIKEAVVEEYVKTETEEIQKQSVNSDGISVSDIKNLDGSGPIADIS